MCREGFSAYLEGLCESDGRLLGFPVAHELVHHGRSCQSWDDGLAVSMDQLSGRAWRSLAQDDVVSWHLCWNFWSTGSMRKQLFCWNLDHVDF